jgi:hypothetical protein
MLIHGAVDDSVPCELSRGYAERKKQAGERVELITLENTGHFEIVDPESDVWAKVQGVFVAFAGP